ncbi:MULTISPECIES: flagellar biosynthesis anti-sigma factor FlgM [Cupriavidus]|uniref:Negative regulator of flagellin synthesis n=2 Tax=Cupriavidus TaxID=106589 RepID=A0A316ELG3_9BURK|nr:MULTISPECIES: flagellar biosynthesis anti-sigma factor FlgM [Cupriavidus]NYI02431.1 negative regulator of flagellin synthesis FlgM [Cupriavidus plantarum]PWK31636.1 FlgM family anti-sigma-28 factor [Cupriavidus plantarum]QET05427.1 flagellar biosynthesis anti-sigma factor FlgM [Cupriavidus pauculus]REE85422.1 FlgM family anti-sigma-28 factor [Cupriavidus plantarum]RLK28714.1 FlgM family anti-sigma-28 factor [Cupriavidus plantarum]
MKINQSTTTRPADNAAGDAARPAAAAATPQDPAALSGVRVSPLAAQVREIGNRLVNDTDDDIDTAKVEEIRQAIAEGRIKIDPSKIADGLLASLRELAQGDTQQPS